MLTALNQSFHIECFKCDSCSKHLNDESFLEINNKAYCRYLFIEILKFRKKLCQTSKLYHSKKELLCR